MDDKRFDLAFRGQHKYRYDDTKKFDFGLAKLPKEFRKKWIEAVDRRFALILFMSFIFHFITALYFALNPPKGHISTKDIKRIQEQYASLVLKEEVVEVADTDINSGILGTGAKQETERVAEKEGSDSEDEGSGSKTKAGERGNANESRRGSRAASLEARRKTRNQISREVSSKGILGILSSSGSTASGSGVADVLGDVDAGGGNLDEVLSQLDGIKVANAGSGYGNGSGSGSGVRGGSRGVKGSRTTSGGGSIDALISERSTAKSTNVRRKGSLVVAQVSEIEGANGIKSESRNADDVSAVVNKHNSAIQYCYQRELKRNPNLKGKVVVRFTISPSGRVKAVSIVSSTLNNARVERCIISRIRRWDDFGSVDPSKGDAVFRQVYTFGY
ncbi:TonB family protein [candidate division KSB1 bacterium]|nr:TonB family protein [candidate division KSB1 bacterium]